MNGVGDVIAVLGGTACLHAVEHARQDASLLFGGRTSLCSHSQGFTIAGMFKLQDWVLDRVSQIA